MRFKTAQVFSELRFKAAQMFSELRFKAAQVFSEQRQGSTVFSEISTGFSDV